MLLDWRARDAMSATYDIIMGSDIVYIGCPVKDLYEVFKKFLRVGGKGIIIIPDRKNYGELFSKEIEKEVFEFEKEELTDSRYMEPVL
jgi:protein-L-isoaspartate O-methyltransferase